MTDDWPAPTKIQRGPFTIYRSNAGFGTTINVGRRMQWATRRSTSRMWPRISRGTDENCNRAIVVVLWPLGRLTVWWEPTWRDNTVGPCETCRAESRAEGCCEWCGSRPCGCEPCRHPKWYFCPTSGENECPDCGGFDACCDDPEAHGRPRLMQDGVTDDLPVMLWRRDKRQQ